MMIIKIKLWQTVKKYLMQCGESSFFLMMSLLNGILFPLTDEGITTQILIKSAITSLIGTLIFLGLIYLIRKYKLY